VMASLGWAKEFTLLENNCMQSIATAAGYMTAPLISSLAAYMMVTNSVIPMFTTFIWVMALAVLGVLFAFPLKRRFINDEQHPFPEGRAAGIVMDSLHTGDAGEGVLKAKLLAMTGGVAALLKIMQSHAIMAKIKVGFLTIPEFLDGLWYRWFTPAIMGTPLKELTVRPDTDFVMMAAGGLMGIRTGISIMVGAIVNYMILAPWMISRGDIIGHADEAGIMHFGFKPITVWALWCGVAMMTTASLFAFFSKPRMLLQSFSGLLGGKKKAEGSDVLRDIELPIKVSVIGIPVVGAIVVLLAHHYFGVHLWMGALAVPLVFVFTLIAAHSTALTSITPTGALGKLTQLTYGAIAPGNITTNLMTAGITGEVASNSSNLLMDIKPGYMLGGKPRQQAIGHILGIVAGACAAVPVFYYIFLKGDPAGLVTAERPMPAATIWRAVAEVLANGLDTLATSARYAALVGALLGIILEAIKVSTRGRFWLSGVGIGLAFVIPFNTCLAMFIGSFFFWFAGKMFKDEESPANRIIVQNQEPICAGVIAGGALMGIAVIAIETFVL